MTKQIMMNSIPTITNKTTVAIKVVTTVDYEYPISEFISSSNEIISSLYAAYKALAKFFSGIPPLPERLETVGEFLIVVNTMWNTLPAVIPSGVQEYVDQFIAASGMITVNIGPGETASAIDLQNDSYTTFTTGYFSKPNNASQMIVSQLSTGNVLSVEVVDQLNWTVTDNGVFPSSISSETSDELYDKYPMYFWDNLEVTWEPIQRLGYSEDLAVGEHAVVAITEDNIIIENHKSHLNNELYYSIGIMYQNNPKDISWTIAQQFDQGNDQYLAVGSFNSKSYALNVHTSDRSDNDNLYYNIGIINRTSIAWLAKGKSYTTGSYPSVACYGNTCVEIHQGRNNGDDLYYAVGSISSDLQSVNLPHTFKKFDTGNRPSVSIFENICIYAHTGSADSTRNNLYVGVGLVFGSEIIWGESSQYDTGSAPKISLYDSGKKCIEVHRSSGGNDDLHFRVGIVNLQSKSIEWCTESSQPFNDTGHEVTVAAQGYGNFTIQAHKSSSSSKHDLYYQLGVFDSIGSEEIMQENLQEKTNVS